MKNTLSYGLRHTYQDKAVVIQRTIFGTSDVTEELDLTHAREVLQELRQQLDISRKGGILQT